MLNLTAAHILASLEKNNVALDVAKIDTTVDGKWITFAFEVEVDGWQGGDDALTSLLIEVDEAIEDANFIEGDGIESWGEDLVEGLELHYWDCNRAYMNNGRRVFKLKAEFDPTA